MRSYRTQVVGLLRAGREKPLHCLWKTVDTRSALPVAATDGCFGLGELPSSGEWTVATQDRSQLQAALATLDSQGSGKTHHQRRHVRFAVEADAWLHCSPRPGGLNESIPVIVGDISRGGAGVVASRRLENGDSVPLMLCDGSLILATLPAFVRHCRPIPEVEGTFHIGLDFGIDAGVLISLGINQNDVLRGDQAEFDMLSTADSFCSPDDLFDSDAA